MSENDEKYTSKLSCFVQTTAPKPKDMQFEKIENRVKQQIFTLEKLQP